MISLEDLQKEHAEQLAAQKKCYERLQELEAMLAQQREQLAIENGARLMLEKMISRIAPPPPAAPAGLAAVPQAEFDAPTPGGLHGEAST